MQQTYSRRRLQSIITCSSAQSAVKHLIVLIWLEDVLGSTKPGKWDTSNVAFAWSLVFYDFFIISIKHIYKNDHFLFKHLGTYQYLKKHEARHRFEQVWKKKLLIIPAIFKHFFFFRILTTPKQTFQQTGKRSRQSSTRKKMRLKTLTASWRRNQNNFTLSKRVR